jgi:hypothetical protein
MKAIVTKYHGPTNNRGSRITASDEDGNRVTISYPYELSDEACHRAAADALCAKMNWRGSLIGGSLKNGYVFTFGPTWESCCAASHRIADLVYLDPKAREVAPTSTWAEIIAFELDVPVPE